MGGNMVKKGSARLPARGRRAPGAAASPAGLPARPRPWWKWLLTGLLLVFSGTVTVLYGATLIPDLSHHRWAAALDASRDAVPALVGWAALVIVLTTGGRGAAARRMLSADSSAVVQKHKQAERDQESARDAALRVEQLTAKLAQLTAARGRQELRPGTRIDTELAGTRARLDQARQWLAGAQAALAISQQQVGVAEDKLAADFPEPADQPGPAARRRPA
jgi:hypothetical protein